MVFASYRQATEATRGGKARSTVIVAAAASGLVAVGLILWLLVSGPVAPPQVSVALAVKPPAPPPATEAPAGGDADSSGLTEQTANGLVPVAATDGRTARKVYARPFDPADKRPRIAVIIDGLGASATAADAAIRTLPPGVTLGFLPYWKPVGQWVNLARAGGHEVVMDLPMEPLDAAHDDPGPAGLRNALDPAANTQRLEWIMAQATGYVGLVGYQGGRFSGEPSVMQPVLKTIARRGLLYVDNRASAQSVSGSVAGEVGLQFALITRQLDADPSRDAVARTLVELEAAARHDGSAIGLASATPSVVDMVAAWVGTLGNEGIALAPVSAVAAIPPTQATLNPKVVASDAGGGSAGDADKR